MSNEFNPITGIEEAEALIAEQEAKKQSVYTEIGKLYFVKHSADCEPEFKPLVDEIVGCSGRIAEINRELYALKSGPTCPICGRSVKEDSVFCIGCGNRLKAPEPVAEEPAPEPEPEPVIEEPAAEPAVIICPRCGREMRPGMRFCTACGCPLEEAPAVEPEPVQEFVPEPMPEPETEPVVEEPAPEPEPVIEEPAAEPEGIICPRCGREMRPGMRFCTACGCPLEEVPAVEPEPEPIVEEPAPEPEPEPVVEEPAAEPEGITCPRCGSQMRFGMRFCTACGCPLEEAPVEEPDPVQEFVPEPMPEPEPEPIVEEPAPEPEPDPVVEEPTPKPEPDPVVEEPAPEPEPEPIVEEPAPEPEPEPIVEEPAPDPNVVICPRCGREMKQGMRFCIACGCPLEEQPAEEPEPMPEPMPEPEPEKKKAENVAAAPSEICPKCGEVSAPGCRFCIKCGNPLFEDEAPAPAQDPGVRRCPNCGFVCSKPGMRFCTECGTPLN